MHPPMHYFIRDHATTPRCSLNPLWRYCLEVLFLNICGPLHMILPLENQDLSLLDICHVGATLLFAFFPLEVSETTIPFGLLRLTEQLASCSALVNALARLRLFANTIPTAPFKV
ncbi:hypothetical protein GW17_00043475 [Ensete ventricosum]|nr:hypothetical protein GW17_00043475 [Ensete ventricosum]RZR90259.1 hypothetical protein BHM03_00018112 [Ensete ventricosum]